MSFLEIGGLFGSIASGYVTDKLVQKVGRHCMLIGNHLFCMRRPIGLMVGAMNSGSSGLGSSTDRSHCVVFLGKTLYFHMPLSLANC